MVKIMSKVSVISDNNGLKRPSKLTLRKKVRMGKKKTIHGKNRPLLPGFEGIGRDAVSVLYRHWTQFR